MYPFPSVVISVLLSMAFSRSYNVPLFNGDNFLNWKFRMESLLTEHDVVASVKYENYLTDDSTDTSGSKMDKPERKRKDNVAKNIIVQCIHDNQLNLLRNKNSAYEMWNALIDTFQKKGLSGKLVLKKEIVLHQNAGNRISGLLHYQI